MVRALLVVLVAAAQAAKDHLSLVSRATGAAGAPADLDADYPAISADGRLVAFGSDADNLSSEDNDAFTNVFVRDLSAQTTILVSRADGVAADGPGSKQPAISADGRFVAFTSAADNVSTDDGDGTWDVFVHDRQTHTTHYASRASGAGGAFGDGTSGAPSISHDGRYVAFASIANTLSGDDLDGTYDVFVRDLLTNTTVHASRTGDGTAADSHSSQPSISADGRFVAFTSDADNLTGDDDDDYWNIFVRDLRRGATTYVSGAPGAAGNSPSEMPAISADGRYVAFTSAADNLSGDDDDGFADVFVHDLHAHATRLVSRAAGATGAAADDHSAAPAISGDGRHVAFASVANNLSAEDNDVWSNVFRRDVLGDPPPPPAIAPLGTGPAAPDTTGPVLRASTLARANRAIRVSRRGRFTLFCGRYAESVTGTCRVRKLAARPFTAAPGKRALARFRLARAQLRALTKAGRLTMRAIVVAGDRSGNATRVRFRVVLRRAPNEER